MSTRLSCLTCGAWLSACRCASPVPASEDGRPVVRGKAWTQAEIVALLQREAGEQEQAGRDRLASHLVAVTAKR